MWLMLQQEKPDDYVLATGETHSVREFVVEAFRHIGIEIEYVASLSLSLSLSVCVCVIFPQQLQVGRSGRPGGWQEQGNGRECVPLSALSVLSLSSFSFIVEIRFVLTRLSVVLRVDPRYYRPTEVDLLLGNPAKAKAKLGWYPRIDFKVQPLSLSLCIRFIYAHTRSLLSTSSKRWSGKTLCFSSLAIITTKPIYSHFVSLLAIKRI
jgi:GDPmannose 4,6-dehydratase